MAAKQKIPVAMEKAEQAAFFQWLKISAPQDLWATCIPGGDGKVTRAPGFCAGAPDCLIIYRSRAILIEMKRRRGGKLSAEQILAHAAITLAGGVVVVAYGWEDAAAQLRLLVPMRSRVAA
jgi:hypothetical protein